MFIQIRQRCRVSTVLNLASSHLGRALHDQGKDSRILLIEILTSWVHHVTHVKGFTTAKKKRQILEIIFMLDKKRLLLLLLRRHSYLSVPSLMISSSASSEYISIGELYCLQAMPGLPTVVKLRTTKDKYFIIKPLLFTITLECTIFI